MGKPAAVVGSYHTCPAKRGKTPHVGGPVAGGSSNVFIGGVPAARVGDPLICNAPPDAIAAGSATVFINGKPAARQGDRTVHGGVIVSGNASVEIGDKTYAKDGVYVGAGDSSEMPHYEREVSPMTDATYGFSY
ncbi:PAAR domain-containing protein [Pokkaliibacter sp. CJK22405]|uniref:PAAR domain-containing protein n=1 Tax=Pokkaliibacter sp. CJK22405 TaxID=3384615 RepID=UPI0039853221